MKLNILHIKLSVMPHITYIIKRGYLVGGWTGLLLGTYRGGLSTWGPVTVSCSWALGYPFLWGLGWGDLVGDWSGWTPHHNVGSKYIFGLFTLKILVTCREGKWGLLGKNIGDTYSFGVVMWSDVSKKTWVLYPRHEIFFFIFRLIRCWLRAITKCSKLCFS